MRPLNLLDDVLDALIVPSFSRLGPVLRRRLFDWDEPDLTGRRIAITGPTSGLGLAAARQMAAAGAELVLLARNPDKASRVRDELAAVASGPVIVVRLDLSSLQSVEEAGGELAGLDRLDGLVHNGGALHGERQLSPDGIELTLATHVVAPFALTGLALPALRRSSDARVISVTSGGMYSQRLHLDDLQTVEDYKGPVAYARAKRAQVVLTGEWARRLGDDTSISFHAMHPGWAATPGLAEALPRFDRFLTPILRSPEQGADTIAWLCGAPAPIVGTGDLWLDRRRRPEAYVPGTGTSAPDADRLWTMVVDLTGRPDPLAA